MKNKIRQNAFVVFDKTSIPIEIYTKYFLSRFENDGKLKLFIFLGEVPNARGHCILTDLDNGKIIGLYHTNNFREATEDEV